MSDRVIGPVGTALLLENDRVRIWEMAPAPGEKSATHRRRYYEKGGSGRVLGEGHRVAKSGQALGVIAREAVRVEAIEVVAAQLAV
jgi:hypothetical protein